MAYAGKNGYDIRTEVLFSKALDILAWLAEKEKEETFDLSLDRISLYQVGHILENIGYEKIDMSQNGWEMDYQWLYKLTNKNKDIPEIPCEIKISGSGVEGIVFLSIDEEGE